MLYYETLPLEVGGDNNIAAYGEGECFVVSVHILTDLLIAG